MIENEDTIQSLLFDCQCALFLVDTSKKQSLEKLGNLLEKISLSDFSCLKAILVENQIGENIEVDEDKIKEFMEKNEIKDNFKISIKEGKGIEELSNKIKEYINYQESDIPNNFSYQLLEEYLNEISPKDYNKELKSISLIFIGNSSVGKTCLFLRLNKNYFKESFLSTIGIDRVTRTFKYKEEIYHVSITDTAGQDRYRTLPGKYYVNADGIFLLFDLTNQESFNDVSVWLTEVKNHIGNPTENKKGPIIYLIGNKLDKTDRVISREEAENKAGLYGIKYFEISCKLNINIQEMYSRMVFECSKNITNKTSQTTFQVKTEKKPKKKKANLCC